MMSTSTLRHFPFVAVLQADITGQGRSRTIAFMIPHGALANAPGRLLAVLRFGDREFHLALEAMTSVQSLRCAMWLAR